MLAAVGRRNNGAAFGGAGTPRGGPGSDMPPPTEPRGDDRDVAIYRIAAETLNRPRLGPWWSIVNAIFMLWGWRLTSKRKRRPP